MHNARLKHEDRENTDTKVLEGKFLYLFNLENRKFMFNVYYF